MTDGAYLPGAGSQAARVRWIHLSDFHLRERLGWEQDTVLKSMISDLRDRVEQSPDLRPDLVFITGDVAFSGDATEYLSARSFLQKLKETLGVSKDRVFIVPGNHDVDRRREEYAFRGAREVVRSTEECDRFFAHSALRKSLYLRQEQFRKFVNDEAPSDGEGWTETSFIHTKSVQVGAIKVFALLLDSTWLANGGEDDVGKLLVGERQVRDALAANNDGPALVFCLMHHPLSWLQEIEQNRIENLLLSNCHVVLRGHVHSAEVKHVIWREHCATLITAGATFQTRNSRNCYALGEIDLLRGVGKVTTYHYDSISNSWDPREESWPLWRSEQSVMGIAEALEFAADRFHRYPNYVASLLSNTCKEVPREFNGQYAFVGYDVEVPGATNDLGVLLLAVKRLLEWKSVWEAATWNREVETACAALELQLEVLTQNVDVRGGLVSREENYRAVNSAYPKGPASSVSGVVQLAQALIEEGELERFQRHLARWRGTGVIRQDEDEILTRLEVEGLMTRQKFAEALPILELSEAAYEDKAIYHGLVAVCAFNLKQYDVATTHINIAIDSCTDRATVRPIAMMIAGGTGDAELARRVSQ